MSMLKKINHNKTKLAQLQKLTQRQKNIKNINASFAISIYTSLTNMCRDAKDTGRHRRANCRANWIGLY